MSKIVSLYTCHENQIDEKGNTVAYYQANLPHGKEIAEAFIGEWNKDAERMVEIMNEQVAKGRVESCKARQYDKNGDKTTIAIEIVAKPGKQLRRRMREDIFDFMDSQFCDGWGEGFFGSINPITAKDGTVFCIE